MAEEKRYGLIGERLGHSYSPRLHSLLGEYHYELIPLPPQALDRFLREEPFAGLNVTIPYKQSVIPYCAELSETARQIGSVNTLVRQGDGTLYGDNTDAYGFAEMARRARIGFGGRKTLVLGSGGTSLTACAVIRAAGGEPVVISRQGPNTYEHMAEHRDAEVLVNTTPVGMYPATEAAPVDLQELPRVQGVLDVIYNPLRTRLLQQAEALGLAHGGGLTMLVMQAVRACERFTGISVPEERVQNAISVLRREATNLVLVGMPGCGKTTVGNFLAKGTGRPLVDIDSEIERTAGCTIPEIFAQEGEAAFRKREAAQIARYGQETGRILVTGGGAVLAAANRESLRLNGFVAHITRSLKELSMEGRPLSQSPQVLEKLWAQREPLYAACADTTVANDKTPGACAQAIWEAYDEAFCGERP